MLIRNTTELQKRRRKKKLYICASPLNRVYPSARNWILYKKSHSLLKRPIEKESNSGRNRCLNGDSFILTFILRTYIFGNYRGSSVFFFLLAETGAPGLCVTVTRIGEKCMSVIRRLVANGTESMDVWRARIKYSSGRCWWERGDEIATSACP